MPITGLFEHGSDKHTNRARTLFVTPMYQPATRCTVLRYGPVLVLTNGLDESAYFYFQVPSDYVGDGVLKLVWSCTVASGNLNYAQYEQHGASGEAYNAESSLYAVATVATGGANIVNVTQHPSGGGVTGITAGDYVGVSIRRRADLVADTLDANVSCIGILLAYTAEQ